MKVTKLITNCSGESVEIMHGLLQGQRLRVCASRRAQPSAARISSTQRAGIAGARDSTVSISAAMSGNRQRPSRNAPTATSFAAFSTAGVVPPASAALRARARAGKRSRSGASKSRRAARRMSSDSTPELSRSGQPSACAIGVRMSGLPSCASIDAVDVFDQRVHDALRMHDHFDLRGRQAEQQAGLDQLQALVHQRRRIHRDLAPHDPARMRARLVGSDSA